jgi:hypothetical protein
VPFSIDIDYGSRAMLLPAEADHIIDRLQNPEQKFLPKTIDPLKDDHRDFLILAWGIHGRQIFSK